MTLQTSFKPLLSKEGEQGGKLLKTFVPITSKNSDTRHVFLRFGSNCKYGPEANITVQRPNSKRTWRMGPYAGADYNLTLSHSRLRSSAFHINKGVNEFFPNFTKMEHGIGGGGREGWEPFFLRIDILWSMGNPIPEMTLTPFHGWL
jgi:hypothetical protein